MKLRSLKLVCSLILLIVPVSMVVTSCGTATKISYLQDLHDDVTIRLQEAHDILLQPGDKLSIIVHSREHDLAQIYNLVSSNNRLQNNLSSGVSGTSPVNMSNNNFSLYTIDNDGHIEIPNLGVVNTTGLTRLELAESIQEQLLSRDLLNDAVVTVEYANLCYSVVGEVNKPGRQMIDRDRITLLEALAQAGDLTIHGKRENILVLRTEDGIQKPYRVNLTETNSLYSSPAFYLQQNDLIIVEPTKYRANESKLNANTTRTPSFWISIASLLMTIGVFLTK